MTKEQMNKLPKTIGDNLDFASTESYNLLRSAVEFACLDEDRLGGKIIGITSPSPQDGKSTTAINLAYSIAKKNETVLLVDADLRRPSIAKTLGISRHPGLTDFLVDDSRKVIYGNVLHENMNVIASGALPPNPSELVGSPKMKQALKRLSYMYNYVIVDLPPVISVSDALATSSALDGMLLVVRNGHTRKTDLREALRQLELTHVNILGFVYNGVGASHGYYRKERRYGKNYGYSSNIKPEVEMPEITNLGASEIKYEGSGFEIVDLSDKFTLKGIEKVADFEEIVK